MTRSKESSIVTKCALVMDVLSRARQPLPFAEIVARTGFVKSSCHRILAVLQSEDMIAYDKQSRTYTTGARLRRWARTGLHRHDIQDAASAVMDALSSQTELNAALSVLDNDCIVYVRTSDFVSLRFAARGGDRAPLHSTAAGKMFLATMEPELRADTLAQLKLEQFTEFTKITAAELEDEIPTILEQGFAVAVREEYLHVIGMSAPIRNAQGRIVACLSLWTQTEDSTVAELMARAPALLDAVTVISKQIGWNGRRDKVTLDPLEKSLA